MLRILVLATAFVLTASSARAKDCSARAASFTKSIAGLKQGPAFDIQRPFELPRTARGEPLTERAPLVMFRGESVFIDGVIAVGGDIVATMRDENPKVKVAYLAVTESVTLKRIREALGDKLGELEWRILVEDPHGASLAGDLANSLFRLSNKCPGVARAFQRAGGYPQEEKWGVVKEGLNEALTDCKCEVDTRALQKVVRTIIDPKEQPIKWRRIRLELPDAGLRLGEGAYVDEWVKADDARRGGK